MLHVDTLPSDYYAIFKNVTKFSYWELKNFLTLNGLEDTMGDRRTFNQRSRALTPTQFHENKANINPNPRGKIGVPQGSPISATLANIYMLSADKRLHEYVTGFGGFYMRYSDDFMIVLPDKEDSVFLTQYAQIKAMLDSIPELNLQDKKIKLFYVRNHSIVSCSREYIPTLENSKNAMDFLGFTYDGKAVTIREKTLSKYDHRLYCKAKTIVCDGGYTPAGRRISCKNCMRSILTKALFPIRSAKRLNVAETFHTGNSAGISSTMLNVRNLSLRMNPSIVEQNGICKCLAARRIWVSCQGENSLFCWNAVDLGGTLTADPPTQMCDNAYQPIFETLTKKLQHAILEETSRPAHCDSGPLWNRMPAETGNWQILCKHKIKRKKAFQ